MLGTVAERPAHNCRGEPGGQGGCSGEREPGSMWSELASLQLPQEMSSPVHCVLIKRAWVFEGVAFAGAWKRGQVLIWLCVGETRARPLDTRTGPADIAGDPAVSPPVWPPPASLPGARVLQRSRQGLFPALPIPFAPPKASFPFPSSLQREGHCPRSLSSGHSGPGRLCAF